MSIRLSVVFVQPGQRPTSPVSSGDRALRRRQFHRQLQLLGYVLSCQLTVVV